MSTIATSKMNSKTTPKKYKYRSRFMDLWSPPKGWLASYRCHACREVMSKKEASKSPQRINACGHITCAKCIVKSYFVDQNPLCPVKDCGVCVDPKTKVTTSASVTPENSVLSVESDECLWGVCMCDETFSKEATATKAEDYYDYMEHEESWHYCGDWLCPGTCGTLVCGCIDICRGKCGAS